jgi:LPXTG-motif cell wall-anchored protein
MPCVARDGKDVGRNGKGRCLVGGRWLARAGLTVAFGTAVWVALSMAQGAAADGTPQTGADRTATTGAVGTPRTGADKMSYTTGDGTDQTAAEGNGLTAGQSTDTGTDSTGDAVQAKTDCDHAGPYKSEDVWVFTGARLETVTFESPTGQRLVLTPSNQASKPGRDSDADWAYDLAGHRVEWVRVPAGWTLVGVTPSDVRLVGACPAGGPAAGTQAAAVGAQGAVGAQAPAAAGARPPEAPTLPQTGADVGAMVTLGLALVVTGAVLLFVKRKRPSPPARPRPSWNEDTVWTYPS